MTDAGKSLLSLYDNTDKATSQNRQVYENNDRERIQWEWVKREKRN